MLIPHFITANGPQLYDLFYALPFYLVTFAMLVLGLRKGYPLLSFVLILGVGRMGFLLGTWVGGGGQGRSTLFSVIFALALLLPVIRYLRFKHPLLDLYALFLPLGMAMQRLGCLSIGCCFGMPTDSIFGIQYELPGAIAHTEFLHPVPLYFLFGYLGITALLFVLRRRIAFSGGLAFLSLALMSLLRFVVEFFRDPYSNQMLTETWFGVKGLQWIALGFMFLFLGIYVYLWRKSLAQANAVVLESLCQTELNGRERMVGIGLLLCFLVSVGVLNQAEWVAMLPSIILLAGAVLWELRRLHLPRILIATLFSVLCVTAAVPDSSAVWKGFLVSGITQGNYNYPTESEEGCGGTYYTKFQDRNYSHASLGARISREDLQGIRTYMELEALGYVGSFYGNRRDWNWNMKGINTHADFNFGWFGTGFGYLHGTRPQGSIIAMERPYGHFQIGNFRNGYVVAGIRDDFAGSPYLGIGGTLGTPKVRFGVGGVNSGAYGNLSWAFPEQGATIELRGLVNPKEYDYDAITYEGSLKLVMDLPY